MKRKKKITLMDVVKKKESPEKLRKLFSGKDVPCPKQFPYLTGHFQEDLCGVMSCRECWQEAYLEEGESYLPGFGYLTPSDKNYLREEMKLDPKIGKKIEETRCNDIWESIKQRISEK